MRTVLEITVEQMYRIENKGHAMGFLKKFMMENAGAAATRRLVDAIGGVNKKNILVIAGLGNNGGDGMVMARHLAGRGAAPVVLLLGSPDAIKTEESRWNWSLLKAMDSVSTHSIGEQFAPPAPKLSSVENDTAVGKYDVLIDAIFGTGISGDIREPYASAISYVNSQDTAFKLAVDVPSGLDPQTGTVANAYTKCDMTVTFHRTKQGIPKRPDLTGILHSEPIGIPPEAEEGIVP